MSWCSRLCFCADLDANSLVGSYCNRHEGSKKGGKKGDKKGGKKGESKSQKNAGENKKRIVVMAVFGAIGLCALYNRGALLPELQSTHFPGGFQLGNCIKVTTSSHPT